MLIIAEIIVLKNKKINKNGKIKAFSMPELCPRLTHFCHIFKKENVLDSKGRKNKIKQIERLRIDMHH